MIAEEIPLPTGPQNFSQVGPEYKIEILKQVLPQLSIFTPIFCH